MHYFCTNYLTQYPCTALVPIPGKPQYHRSTTKGQGNHLCGWTHEPRAAFSLSLSLSLKSSNILFKCTERLDFLSLPAL